MKKGLKILVIWIIAIISIATFNTNSMAATTSPIKVLIEGKNVIFDTKPQIISGRTLVPMRAIFEALGLTVSWDNVNMIASGTNSEYALKFKIGSNKATVNGKSLSLDVAASQIGGRTMIPLRFLSENMGYNVVWDAGSNIISISKSSLTGDAELDYKAKCQMIEYKVLSKNTDEQIGNYVWLTGYIVQIIESGTAGNYSTFILLNTYTNDDYQGNTAIFYEGKVNKYEDDFMSLWGEINGSYTYESVARYNLTIPSVSLMYYE